MILLNFSLSFDDAASKKLIFKKKLEEIDKNVRRFDVLFLLVDTMESSNINVYSGYFFRTWFEMIANTLTQRHSSKFS